MGYRSLQHALRDLERHGHLRVVREELSPDLELAEIQRRLYRAGGPAVLFERVHGTPFPAVANLFGTMERCRFLFRDTIDTVRKIVALKADPSQAWRAPLTNAKAPLLALRSLPRKVRNGPGLARRCRVSQLPAIKSWPDDGGPFVTLPQVFTLDPRHPSPMKSNLGMYRIQLAGNDYEPDREIGLHFQLHRGIGVHYAAARDAGEELRVSIFVGGPPAHTLAAVMPLPEGLSELLFAGMLGRRRFRLARRDGHVVSADADFTICGRVRPGETKPEGPFGDHLGYYALKHDFPVLHVDAVWHRTDAVWPFTVVGRPPQEDTSFGQLIHELTAPMVPVSVPGLHEMHAVDTAGVHPLMLAIGSERYVPYEERQPREILTVANAVLGFGQASLAKYLVIAAHGDEPGLSTHDEAAFWQHVLARIDWRRDLHFQTRTTIDTLDYSGTGLNEGSKVVLAAAGAPIRELATRPPAGLPAPIRDAALPIPGVLTVSGLPAFTTYEAAERELATLCEALSRADLKGVALVTLCDDAPFAGENLANWQWVTFTRSNPSHDVHGLGARLIHKHWGCEGPLVIDARIKPHHAPPLIEDPAVTRRIDALAAKGGPLEGLF